MGYASIMRVQWSKITASLFWQLSLTLKLTTKQNNEDIMFCMKFSGAPVMKTLTIYGGDLHYRKYLIYNGITIKPSLIQA